MVHSNTLRVFWLNSAGFSEINVGNFCCYILLVVNCGFLLEFMQFLGSIIVLVNIIRSFLCFLR